ncbi:MAG: Fumarate reductase, subunit [Pseudomonadota bacterium]|jgi:fumarate reductase subunit C
MSGLHTPSTKAAGRNAPLVGPSKNPPRTSAKRGGYRRPMGKWWQRNAFFKVYMLREVTAVGVGLYALILAVGVLRLSQGEAAWNGWLAALKSPLSLALHALLLVSMIEHARSWFEIMPKTMPYLYSGGKPVAPSTIQRSGWAAAVIVAVGVYVIARWWQGA